MKKYCCCCGKQIVDYRTRDTDPDRVYGPNPRIMGPNNYCCDKCVQLLDKNGLFPEEQFEE